MKFDKTKEIIKQSLQELEKKYCSNQKDFLTEADVVSFLISNLRKKIKEGLRVHSQLRPFYQTEERYYVIKKEGETWGWRLQRKANEGAVFDVVVVDDYDRYFKQALEKARKDQGAPLNLKYWRMLSYPVEAFHAVLEVKIRLSGNVKEIGQVELPKLSAIQEKRNCLLYYVVIDRCFKNEDRESLKKFEENYKGRIYLEILPRAKQEVIK